MDIQTLLNAYGQAKDEQQLAVSQRPKGLWGIMIRDDDLARLYQKRQRQADKFMTAICQKSAPPVERKQRDELLTAAKLSKHEGVNILFVAADELQRAGRMEYAVQLRKKAWAEEDAIKLAEGSDGT